MFGFQIVRGGVTNRGTAVAADVTSGKTFSNSTLTNATGTSTKNASVPANAPIQPPQAFVEALGYQLQNVGQISFYFPNVGIIDFNPDLAGWSWDAILEVRLDGNALNSASVNRVLSALVAAGNTVTCNLSGGTSAAPTGQGLTDKATLISNGSTITTN